MKDLFYTILVVWIIWRIFNGFNASRANRASDQVSRPSADSDQKVTARQRMSNDEGEYVDYEEIK